MDVTPRQFFNVQVSTPNLFCHLKASAVVLQCLAETEAFGCSKLCYMA